MGFSAHRLATLAARIAHVNAGVQVVLGLVHIRDTWSTPIQVDNKVVSNDVSIR